MRDENIEYLRLTVVQGSSIIIFVPDEIQDYTMLYISLLLLHYYCMNAR